MEDGRRVREIPSGSIETAAIRGGRNHTLQTLSDDFSAASLALVNSPSPPGGSAERNRFRLGLLVDSEATRAAEAACDVTNTQIRMALDNEAQGMAVIGNDLWDLNLGRRTIGFSPTVLIAVPA